MADKQTKRRTFIDIQLQWVLSHTSIVGKTVGDRVPNEATSHPSFIDLLTDQTDLLTNLKKDCNLLWDTLQNTTLGHIRQDSQHHYRTHSPTVS